MLFYFFECGFVTEKCIIKLQNFLDASIELLVFSGSNLLAKNEKSKFSKKSTGNSKECTRMKSSIISFLLQ